MSTTRRVEGGEAPSRGQGRILIHGERTASVLRSGLLQRLIGGQAGSTSVSANRHNSRGLSGPARTRGPPRAGLASLRGMSTHCSSSLQRKFRRAERPVCEGCMPVRRIKRKCTTVGRPGAKRAVAADYSGSADGGVSGRWAEPDGRVRRGGTT